jgi:hypothetical protein
MRKNEREKETGKQAQLKKESTRPAMYYEYRDIEARACNH